MPLKHSRALSLAPLPRKVQRRPEQALFGHNTLGKGIALVVQEQSQTVGAPAAHSAVNNAAHAAKRGGDDGAVDVGTNCKQPNIGKYYIMVYEK